MLIRRDDPANPGRRKGLTAGDLIVSGVWGEPGLLHKVQADVVQQQGFRHEFVDAGCPLPERTRVLLIQGPYGPMEPFIRSVEAVPLSERPLLAYWFQQSLDLRRPRWLRRVAAGLFSDLARNSEGAGWPERAAGRFAPTFFSTKGHRLRFLGDLVWLQEAGSLGVLAVSSSVFAEYLMTLGIPSIIVPRGYHPSFGSDLGLERDIAVVWMGKTRTARRRRIIYDLRDALARRGLDMRIHDGEDNDFIFGEARTRLLNRTQFVLNVNTMPTDELSIRFFIAAANGAVVLTEPNANRYAWEPGKHYVECDAGMLENTVLEHLSAPDRLREMSGAMHRLLVPGQSLDNSIASILQAAGSGLAPEPE